MIVFASVLAPETSKLEVPVLFAIEGLAPLISRLPTVNALFCKSSTAFVPLILRADPILPNLPLLVKTIFPANILVPPE